MVNNKIVACFKSQNGLAGGGGCCCVFVLFCFVDLTYILLMGRIPQTKTRISIGLLTKQMERYGITGKAGIETFICCLAW